MIRRRGATRHDFSRCDNMGNGERQGNTTVRTNGTTTRKGLGCLRLDIEGVTRAGWWCDSLSLSGFTARRLLRDGWFHLLGRVLFSTKNNMSTFDVVNGRGAWFFIVIWFGVH